MYIKNKQSLQIYTTELAKLRIHTFRYEHVTPTLRDLHCLRSPEHIDFMLAVLIYRCLHGLVLQYLSDYIQRIADSNCCPLWSSLSSQLVIRRIWLSTVGNRAFPVAGRHLWNSLPPDVTSASKLTVFRDRLKIYLFSRSVPSKPFLVSSSVHRVQ